jgi:hypothetical protein
VLPVAEVGDAGDVQRLEHRVDPLGEALERADGRFGDLLEGLVLPLLVDDVGDVGLGAGRPRIRASLLERSERVDGLGSLVELPVRKICTRNDLVGKPSKNLENKSEISPDFFPVVVRRTGDSLDVQLVQSVGRLGSDALERRDVGERELLKRASLVRLPHCITRLRLDTQRQIEIAHLVECVVQIERRTGRCLGGLLRRALRRRARRAALLILRHLPIQKFQVKKQAKKAKKKSNFLCFFNCGCLETSCDCRCESR